MAKENLMVGLDIGSSKITAVSGYETPSGTLKIISAISKDCSKGIKNGIVRDIHKVSETLGEVLEELEEKSSPNNIEDIYVGVRGTHISSFNTSGIYNVPRADKEIIQEDVDSVIENAKTVNISSPNEIIHLIPQQFIIDRQEGFSNPIGMEGQRLEVKLHIITGEASHLSNIFKSLANAGFSYNEYVYQQLPLAEMLLSEEEKAIGCVFIDMGDQTTSISVYFKDKMYFSKELAIGGANITQDISHAFNVSNDSARILKEKYGCVSNSEFKKLNFDEPVSVLGLDRVTKKSIKPSQLVEIIQPRVEEILLIIKNEIINSGFSDIANCVIITGGASKLKGMEYAVKGVLGVKDVRFAKTNPEKIEILDDSFKDEKYYSAISLIYYPLYIKPILNEYFNVKKKNPMIKKWFSSLKDLFR